MKKKGKKKREEEGGREGLYSCTKAVRDHSRALGGRMKVGFFNSDAANKLMEACDWILGKWDGKEYCARLLRLSQGDSRYVPRGELEEAGEARGHSTIFR